MLCALCRAGDPSVEDVTHLGGWLAYLEYKAQQQAAAAPQ